MKHQITPTIIFALVFSLMAGLSQAQNFEKEPLYFQTYTIEDGLADNWIRDIAQDDQGFMWIATQSGINRFDGYEFETFRDDPQDSTMVSGNKAFDILIDRENNIWVATQEGVGRFENESQSFEQIYSLASVLVSPIPLFESLLYESNDGTLWVGSSEGLARFDTGKQSFQPVGKDSAAGDVLSNQTVTSITESEDGRLWIGTFGGGINILEPETGNISYLRHDPADPESLPDDYIMNLFIDKDQVLWVNYDRRDDLFAIFTADESHGSRSGLWKKDLSNQSVYHYTYQPDSRHPLWSRISDFHQTRDGSLWFGSIGGFNNSLRKYVEQDNSFDTYRYDPNMPGSIPWNFTTSVLEDRFGHLWVGTSRGLAKADRQQLKMKSFTPVIGNRYDLRNNLYGIEEVGENIFWISRDSGTQLIWNRAENSWRDDQNSNSYRLPVSYDGGRYGYLLIDNTIERLNIQTFEKRIYEIDTFDRFEWQIYHFLLISEESLLIGTTQGLWTLNPVSGQSRKIDLSLPFIDDPRVTYLSKGAEDIVWLAIENAPLSEASSETGILIGRYHITDESFEPLETDSDYRNALGSGTLNHLMVDSRGNLWISKTNGLVRYDSRQDSFTIYNEDDGLKYVVIGTLEDDQANIWISTEYGISRLNPETNNIRSYGSDDGLRPARLNRHSFYKRDNGELMFGGVGGISYFMPGDVVESTESPLIQITRIEAGDSEVDVASGSPGEKSPDIEWGSNSITVEYVSVNFRNPEETSYRYRLDGFHDEWVEAGSRRFAQFSNLPPDSYTLRVKAVDANGVESTQPATFTFSVLPPWYRTWWAYGIYALLFVIGVVVTDRVQRRKVQQKEREKAREKELEQAREIEKAYENLKAAQEQLIQQEKLASLGQLTAGIAHEIKNPLNFVNNFSEVSLELIEEVRKEVKTQKAKVKSEKETPLRGGAGGGSEKAQLRQGFDELASPLPSPDGVKGGSEKADEADQPQNPESKSSSVNPPLSPLPGGDFETYEPNPILDILNDIEANLRKIYEHGSRADGIVKSMLQHSRGGDGKMEPTQLNPLIKEYVNLAFHGMRAGNDPIKVDIDLQLDKGVGEIPLVAEDFSRVILNLVNNAFDAMREKTLQGFETLGGLDDYQPKLTVRTHQTDKTITLEIEDNGPGIPDEIKDKILQPFFTTKKGTQGTGLGLSITNDIIKAHGGSLEIKTEQSNGSVFVVSLPNA